MTFTTLITLLVLIGEAALIGIPGFFMTKKLFESKGEAPPSAKKKAVFIAATAAVFLGISALFGLLVSPEDKSMFEVLRTAAAIMFLYYIAIDDIKFGIIPNRSLLVMLIACVPLLAAEAAFDFNGFKVSIVLSGLGSAVCGLMFLITNVLSHNGLGMGDVKLMFVLGLYLGLDSALGGLLWSFCISLLYGVFLMIRKKAKLKTKIPMAPFFFLGVLLSNVMYIITGFIGGE